MHEYSIVQAILVRVRETALERGATGASSVTVRIGDAAGVEIELLRTAWDTFRSGAGLGEPELHVVGAPVAWECASCGMSIDTDGPLRCPRHGYTARLTSGDEILLERVELQVPDAVAGAGGSRAHPHARGEHV